MKPTHSLTRGLVAGTPSSSTSAGGMTSGAISSTKESTKKPSAAVAQMTHCRGVRGAAGAGRADGEDRTVGIGGERLHRKERGYRPQPVASAQSPPAACRQYRTLGAGVPMYGGM